MYKLLIPAISIILSAVFSCQKNAYVYQSDNDELRISISSRGGWCAGADSLTLGVKNTVYVHRGTCRDNFKTENLETKSVEWNELTALLDKEKFSSVRINECGVCYDGTDFTLTVKQGNFEHAIRFDKLTHPKLQTIKPFIEKLLSIRNHYMTQFRNNQ